MDPCPLPSAKSGLKKHPRGSVFQNFHKHNNIWNLAPHPLEILLPRLDTNLHICRPLSHPFVPYIELAMVSPCLRGEDFTHNRGGQFPKLSGLDVKNNNKTIHTLGEWGVEIQIFFWANHLVGGKGALFYRIRDYPLTTVGAAHVAGATIHAPVPLALPLQRMKSSSLVLDGQGQCKGSYFISF